MPTDASVSAADVAAKQSSVGIGSEYGNSIWGGVMICMVNIRILQ